MKKVLLIGLGFLMFGFRIHQAGLWNDEGYTYLLGVMPWPDFLSAFRVFYYAPPLWELLGRATLAIFPHLPWSIRLSSLAASVGTTLLLYAWMRRRINDRTGWLAACLFLTAPMALFYAQEGRNYAVLAFSYLAAIVWAERAWERGKTLDFVLCATFSLTMLYLHSYGTLLLLAINVYFAALALNQKNFRFLVRWCVWQALVALAFLPWLPILLSQTKMIAGHGHYRVSWEGQNWLSIVGSAVHNMVPGDYSPRCIIDIPHLAVFSLAPTLALIVLLAWQGRTVFRQTLFLSILYWLLAPLFLVSLYSQFFSPIFVVGRTEAMVLPFFCVVMAMLVAPISQVLIRQFLAGLLLLTGALCGFSYFSAPDYPRRQWDRMAVERLFHEHRPEVVFLSPQVSAAIPAYLDPYSSKATIMLYPDDEDPASWRRRFLLLKERRPTAGDGSSALQKAFADRSVGEMAIVFYSPGKKKGHWVYPPDIQNLLHVLAQRGFAESHVPYVYPMDRILGFHVILHLRKTRS